MVDSRKCKNVILVYKVLPTKKKKTKNLHRKISEQKKKLTGIYR